MKAGFANRRKFLIKNLEVIVGKKNRGELEKIFNKLSNLSPIKKISIGLSKSPSLSIRHRGKLRLWSIACVSLPLLHPLL